MRVGVKHLSFTLGCPGKNICSSCYPGDIQFLVVYGLS